MKKLRPLPPQGSVRLTARVLYRSVSAMNPADRLASMTWTHDAVGNVITQTEHWFASGSQAERTRATAMSYDGANRLVSETITESGQAQVMTTYSYDAANNRTTKSVEVGPGLVPTGLETGHWSYTSNNVNQLLRVDKRATATGPVMGGAKYTYDANGNRVSKVIDGTAAVTARTTTYTWDTFNRLDMVDEPVSGTVRQKYDYTYDYRTRRTGVQKMAITGSPARHTAIVFSGGVSVAEYERATNTGITPTTVPSVKYGRGPDMGGGVGGLLSTVRNPVNASNVAVNPTVTMPATLRYNLSNGRGDIVAQSDANATLTWTASYEAYGKRTKETGQNKDKQRANTKDEDPTGLLNEGHRYRDIETGGWLSRDPAGFVDGPNLYAYVKQNPWTSFDPDGLYQMMPAAILHANGINTTSHDYQRGVQQGMAQGAKIGLVMTVGVGVTVATGGLATAASAAVFGSGTVATSLSAAALSGAAGSIAANSTGNVLNGESIGKGTIKASITGAAFGAGGQLLGNTALAFKQGMAEGTGMAAKATALQNAAIASCVENGATSGAAGGLVTNRAVATGASVNGNQGYAAAADLRVAAAMDASPAAIRSPYHMNCAEPQMATNLLRAGGQTEGAVSSVGVIAPGSPYHGMAKPPCSYSCQEFNGRMGIIDMNAKAAWSGPGKNGGSAGVVATARETTEREKENK